MKLMRRFKWDDRKTVYLPVDAELLVRTERGMIRFTAVSTTGDKFEGAAFETTVSSMVDAKPYWKLAPNPKKPEKSIIVDVTGVPLPDSPKTKRQVSEKDVKINGQGD